MRSTFPGFGFGCIQQVMDTNYLRKRYMLPSICAWDLKNERLDYLGNFLYQRLRGTASTNSFIRASKYAIEWIFGGITDRS